MMLQNHLRQLCIQKGIAACRNCSTLSQTTGVEFRKDLLSLLLTDPQLLIGQ